MPPAPTMVTAFTRCFLATEFYLFLRVFLEVSLELLPMGLFHAEEGDGKVLSDVVYAVGQFDDRVVVGNRLFLRGENTFDDLDHIGGILGRRQVALRHLQVDTAGDGAAELLDAIA